MAKSSQLNEIIGILRDMEEDSSVPRNVKEKISNIIGFLQENIDIKLRVNKSLHELEEIADDINLDSYTRTQILNIVSLLEKLG